MHIMNFSSGSGEVVEKGDLSKATTSKDGSDSEDKSDSLENIELIKMKNLKYIFFYRKYIS